MKKHPSGRPIRRENKRSYGMWATRRTEFICPRLNEKRHDTHAMGFIDWRVGEYGANETVPDEYEAKSKRR